MKDFLNKMIENKTARANELREKIKTAQTADEIRGYSAELETVENEITEARTQLNKLDDKRGQGFQPLAAYSIQPIQQQRESVYGSMEYREAFKQYVQRGTPIPADLLSRAAGDKGTTLTTEIGAIIPETIMNEFIKDVSKVYGSIYNKVRKLNVRGGVKFPISKLKANVKWISETTVSDRTKAGDIKDFVTFEYNIAEVRVSESLLAQVVSLPVFESEITRIMVEAYVEAMDKAIISGSGEGQPTGITKDTRVTGNTSNIIEMTEAEFSDWTAWRKKLFAKVPLSKRGLGEFLFPASTVESYLLTMKNDNNNPIFREATDLTVGTTTGRFFGREVTLVEPDIIADFDTASNGDIVGIFWVPSDYAINTNMQFGMKRWFDDDTNEFVNKGLTIVDGKILDVSGCYLIKKKTGVKADVPDGTAVLLGKQASELQENIVIDSSGNVTGTLKNIENYDAFEKGASGHFLALYFPEAKEGTIVTCEIKGEGAKLKKPVQVDSEDGLIVLKIADTAQTVEIKSEGKETVTLLLTGLILQ